VNQKSKNKPTLKKSSVSGLMAEQLEELPGGKKLVDFATIDQS